LTSLFKLVIGSSLRLRPDEVVSASSSY